MADGAAGLEGTHTEAQGRLKTLIERIERLEEDKAAVMGDLKEVYGEAKGEGFDVKILRKIISIRKRDQAEVDEEETMLEVYLRALGMRPQVD